MNLPFCCPRKKFAWYGLPLCKLQEQAQCTDVSERSRQGAKRCWRRQCEALLNDTRHSTVYPSETMFQHFDARPPDNLLLVQRAVERGTPLLGNLPHARPPGNLSTAPARLPLAPPPPPPPPISRPPAAATHSLIQQCYSRLISSQRNGQIREDSAAHGSAGRRVAEVWL